MTASTVLSASKNYASIDDEDKIVFEHLFDRHKYLLSHVNDFDAKSAQIIGLSGVILGLIVNATANNLQSIHVLIVTGITIILIGMIIGAAGYHPRIFFFGASTKFFDDYDMFPKGKGAIELKNQLLHDIEQNQKRLQEKSRLFNYLLMCVIAGLIIVMVGYYA